MVHHKIHYPVGNLLRPAPYTSGGGAKAFGPVILAIAAGLFALLPLRIAIIVMLQAAAFLIASDKLHMHYHIKGSWLERFQWFQDRRMRHFYHHGHLRDHMSLGGIDPVFDRLLGTYVEVQRRPGDSHGSLVPLKVAAGR